MWGPAGLWFTCLLLPFCWDFGGVLWDRGWVWKDCPVLVLRTRDLSGWSRKDDGVLHTRVSRDVWSCHRAACGHQVMMDQSHLCLPWKPSGGWDHWETTTKVEAAAWGCRPPGS